MTFGTFFQKYAIPWASINWGHRVLAFHLLSLSNQFPPLIGKEISSPLISLIVWSKKLHCAPLNRLDKQLQTTSLRQVEGQVKCNLIDETVQETNIVHTVLCKDSWACCDGISSRIRGNLGHGTVLSQHAEMKQNTNAASLLFTPKPMFLLSNPLFCLNACLP